MAGNPDSADATGSFADARVADVFEPENDVLGRDARALHRRGRHPDNEVANA
jgi:hypothetical protein